jgi:DNA-binding MarR family transcriptional regulator
MESAAHDRDARRMMESIRALVRRFALSERADVACCGITVAQAATLDTLAASGPMRQNELGRQLGVTPSTLTRNLARLLDAGLVERLADSKDARASRIRLSGDGARAVDAVRRQEQAFAADVLERLPADRREAIVDGLRLLLVAVRGATERCCPGAFDHLMNDFPEETQNGKHCCQ